MDQSKNFVITINRELGSGGRTIGRELAQRLDVKYYDKALIEALTKAFDISLDELEKIKAEKKSWWNDFTNFYFRNHNIDERFDIDYNVATTDNIYEVETEVLRKLAERESCVIAGRSGFQIFRNHPNALKIFIQSSMEKRIARVMKKQSLSRQEAVNVIESIGKARENYTKHFSGTSRYDTRNYDLVLDVTNLSEQDAVDVIMEFINKQS